MATYSNQHWLLCHIRNSFISTDDTGICETVMVSDDLPKSFLRGFNAIRLQQQQQPEQQHDTASNPSNGAVNKLYDAPLTEADFICYPGLDQSDDEDVDLSTQSFDIQMYPEVGAHRFRSNTAQKLEKMDIARRKAARTKSVNFEDEIIPPDRSDFFVRKPVFADSLERLPLSKMAPPSTERRSRIEWHNLKPVLCPPPAVVVVAAPPTTTKEVAEEDNTQSATTLHAGLGRTNSKLSLQLANSPKQAQNKFLEYARFDGTSQTGMQTKRINVFLSMLPEKERNYPIKICVIATAKIIEVIGLVCYKATIQYPDIPLKSIRHYALYMTEDNDDMEDFPPLDNREPCSKFGFTHLTLAERRPLAPITRVDYHSGGNNNNSSSNNNMATKSMTSEEDKARVAAAAVRALQMAADNASAAETEADDPNACTAEDHLNDYEERMLNHNDMLEAPMYRTYRLNVIDKLFLKSEVTLGISGERIEIDQHKNAKFWTKQKAIAYPIDCIAFCEIVDRRHLKATLRIWLRPPSSSGSGASGSSSASKCTNVFCTSEPKYFASLGGGGGGGGGGAGSYGASFGAAPHSPSSPGGGGGGSGPTASGSSVEHHYPPFMSFFSGSKSSAGGGGQQLSHSHQHTHMRFKHYLFEADAHTAEQICNKLNWILKVRSSDVRREFLHLRGRKLEKAQSKKQLKL